MFFLVSSIFVEHLRYYSVEDVEFWSAIFADKKDRFLSIRVKK